MAKSFYITTAIPYVNAAPHIGFALELIQTDVLARFRRLLGDDVFFLTGADENSLKNVQAAEQAGLPVREFVDKNTARFVELAKVLNISNDDFLRTSASAHFAGAQKLWRACRPEDIYKKAYKGFYCVGCEQFYALAELKNGKCPEHQVPPEVVEEENYFFKLSNYQKQLLKILESDKYKVTPATRKNEMLALVRSGLEDFSISRSVKRARGWGVPVPSDDSQVMYVWFDALANYITALDYQNDGPQFKKYWPADVHVVGKGITRFHAVYWPAMLLSAGLPLPKNLFVHGYVTSGGQKMSKSTGNTADPFELVKEYGADAVRYFVLRELHPFEDSDYTPEKFKEAYNANLANGLGNLVSRVMKMAEDNLPTPAAETKVSLPPEFGATMEKFEINKAADFVWDKIGKMDLEIQKTQPFSLVKTNPEEGKKIITKLVTGLWELVPMLQILLPATAERLTILLRQNKMPTMSLFPRKE